MQEFDENLDKNNIILPESLDFPVLNSRQYFSFNVTNPYKVKEGIVAYSKNKMLAVILSGDSQLSGQIKVIAGIGAVDSIHPVSGSFEELKKFRDKYNDWLFGNIPYNIGEGLHSSLQKPENGLCFDRLHFFCPEFLIRLENNNLTIGVRGGEVSEKKANDLYRLLLENELPAIKPPVVQIEEQTSRETYIHNVERLKEHIGRGDIYEINYCVAFEGEAKSLDPYDLFIKVEENTGSPYSAFVKQNELFAICGSPERFMKMEGFRIISQPMKGTCPRGTTPEEDEFLKQKLAGSSKENSENAMIVDLVRNDLSRTCNFVRVEDPFSIYTFRHWHQMVTTVTGQLKEGVDPLDAAEKAFPMGSMTGAPKHRAMELIRKYESKSRGLFSGSIGYIDPAGDFDFNVVIRSVFYNQTEHKISLWAGSAITAGCNAESEYRECLLKAEPLLKALNCKLTIEAAKPSETPV